MTAGPAGLGPVGIAWQLMEGIDVLEATEQRSAGRMALQHARNHNAHSARAGVGLRPQLGGMCRAARRARGSCCC